MRHRRKLCKIFFLSFLMLFIFTKLFFELTGSELENYTLTPNCCEMNLSLSTPVHKVLPQDGYDIHYFLSGNKDGSLIVLLHPAFSDHTVFDSQLDLLGKHHMVLTIDLIGHGLSVQNNSKDKIDVSAKHIVEILDKEGYKQAHLVGISLGSLVAQYFAVQNSDKVLSLTALGGYDINKETDEVKKAQNSSNFGLILRALFSLKSFRIKTAKITAYTTDGQKQFYESSKLYTRKSFLVMSGFSKIIVNRNFTPTYPIFIMAGEHDVPLSLKMAVSWHQDLPGSEYALIPDAGHCANLDNEKVFVDLLINFIDKNDVEIDSKK